MLRERTLSAIFLGIPVLAIVVVGGPWYAIVVFLLFSIALIEFSHLVARRGHRAFGGLMLLWYGLFILDRVFTRLDLFAPGIAILLIVTMAWAVIRFRQGTANAMTGFAFTVAGSFYVGWTMSHLVSLRSLEDGVFWTLTLLVAVWGTDSAAYLVGSQIGRTKLITDISPGKTWEGYIGAIIIASGVTAAFMLLWQQLGASAALSPGRGFVIGLVIAIVTPLGDIAISVLKRYANAKHASKLIPGHGGMLDRVDAMLVGCVLLYYYVILFV